MKTETRLERYRDADRWPTSESLAAMLESQFGALAAVRAALPSLTCAVEAATGRLGRNGRLIYAGAGASGRLGVQDGVELYPTFGWPHDRLVYLMAGGSEALVQSQEGAEDDAIAAAQAVGALKVTVHDVVIGVAASGTTRYTRGVIETAKGLGALTIGLANNSEAPLLKEAEIGVLLDTGPEFLSGSTRMIAGTAQKIALNMFSTQLMIALGRVYDGLMVNVVATNDKLVERSKQMVVTITGASYEAASKAYEEGNRNVAAAVLILDGLTPDAAAQKLAETGGDLRKARGQT